MATWHQQQNQTAIGLAYSPDEKLWKVVNDSPLGALSVMKFADKDSATKYANKTKGFLVSPKNT